MKQRQLGKDGPMVGEIGLGAMSFAGAWGPTDEVTSHRTLNKALELGVTHIDTALIYGPHTSETIIGNYLKKNPSARSRLSIATKGGIQPNPRAVINDAKFMRECLEGSLKRLGVDHVDLYYIHRRDWSIPIEDVTGSMATFVREGKIGGIGFSEIAPASLERAVKVHPIRAVQSEYSLWTRLPELGLLQSCKRHGVAFVAFSPVARGMLTDNQPDPANFTDNDFRKPMPRFIEPNFSANLAHIEGFRAFAKSRGWKTSTLANAWLLHQDNHIIPIPGTRTREHLEEDAAASDIVLDAADLQKVEDLLPVGFAHGNRYSDTQQAASELFC
jgi:aryl-alcohol dehydrogenase-like predicted oxidoreductase